MVIKKMSEIIDTKSGQQATEPDSESIVNNNGTTDKDNNIETVKILLYTFHILVK